MPVLTAPSGYNVCLRLVGKENFFPIFGSRMMLGWEFKAQQCMQSFKFLLFSVESHWRVSSLSKLLESNSNLLAGHLVL